MSEEAKKLEENGIEEGQDMGKSGGEKVKKKGLRKTLSQLTEKGLVGNISFLLFLAVLAVSYIWQSNNAVKVARELNLKKKELKELHWKHSGLEAQKIVLMSEAKLKQKAEKIGLKSLEEPAFEIKIKK